MAEALRVSQVIQEVLAQNARARVAQTSQEVLVQEQARGRMAQVTAEVLRLGQRGRVDQALLEVLLGTRLVPPLPRFPAQLAYGAQGGPGFSTDVVLLADGQESRNVNWAEALCRWDVGSMHRSKAEIEVLVAFFHAVGQGQEGVFLFRDFTDDQFNNALGVGDGLRTGFPLVKRYQVGPYWRERRLTHPLAETLSVALDGVLASAYTLTESAVVQLAAAPAAGVVVSAAGTFEVVCRFAQDALPVTRVAPNAYSCDHIEIVEVRV